jgi:hypothetical protein
MQSNLEKAQKHIQRATDLLGFGSPQSKWQCDGNITTEEFFYKDFSGDTVKFVRHMEKEKMTIRSKRKIHTLSWPVYFCESASVESYQGRKTPVFLISKQDMRLINNLVPKAYSLFRDNLISHHGILPELPGTEWYATWLCKYRLEAIDGLKKIDVPVLQTKDRFTILKDELVELGMEKSLKEKLEDMFPKKYKEEDRFAELWDLYITQNMKISWLYNDEVSCPVVHANYFGYDYTPFSSENHQRQVTLVKSLFQNCNIFSFFNFDKSFYVLVLYATVDKGSVQKLTPIKLSNILKDDTSRKNIVATIQIACETDEHRAKIDSWGNSYRDSSKRLTKFFKHQQSLQLTVKNFL